MNPYHRHSLMIFSTLTIKPIGCTKLNRLTLGMEDCFKTTIQQELKIQALEEQVIQTVLVQTLLKVKAEMVTLPLTLIQEIQQPMELLLMEVVGQELMIQLLILMLLFLIQSSQLIAQVTIVQNLQCLLTLPTLLILQTLPIQQIPLIMEQERIILTPLIQPIAEMGEILITQPITLQILYLVMKMKSLLKTQRFTQTE